jgi:RNA polymerase sigma-70 factor (ECF subfamily)
MRQGQGFCALENPRAWLFQVARHALIDAARLTKPQVELPKDF